MEVAGPLPRQTPARIMGPLPVTVPQLRHDVLAVHDVAVGRAHVQALDVEVTDDVVPAWVFRLLALCSGLRKRRRIPTTASPASARHTSPACKGNPESFAVRDGQRRFASPLHRQATLTLHVGSGGAGGPHLAA